MANQTFLDLPNGAKMPIIGLGTWQAKDEDTVRAVEAALDAGYRLIDTAFSYGNEKTIGETLQRKLKQGQLNRCDIFVTTKVPGMYLGPREQFRSCFNRSYEALGVDYIDLYLIHIPTGVKLTENEAVFPMNEKGELDTIHHDILKTWQYMEELVDEGKVKHLGLSNCNSEQVQRIVDIARYPVSNLQVECHAYLAQQHLFDFCNQRNITLTAYAPIGSPGRPSVLKADKPGDPLSDELILSLAEKYKKTPAQILLRNLVQRGIAVIPKSVTPARINENIQIFDFTLSEEDMKSIAALDRNQRYFNFKHVNGITEHPEYPFKIPF